MLQTPSIFISSTIADFVDLRSALRYYLSSLGYSVYLSELNDFPKELNINTFETTLNTLRASDFYILLVGGRVGGLYDARERVSITRKEYRTAYELAKGGHIRLALFVRDRIWALRSDRQALRQFMVDEFVSDRELSEEEIQALANHPGPFANDPELVFDFVDEIAREVEMQAAVHGRAEFPPANWVHTFSSFSDIVDALRIHLRISTPLGRVALTTNLRREILENLVLLGEKHNGQVDMPYTWAAFARRHLKGGMNDCSLMPAKYVTWALMYSVVATRGNNLSTIFIDQAVQSGEFLEYDPDRGEFLSGWFSERLFDLRERISRLRRIIGIFQERIAAFIATYSDLGRKEKVSIPNDYLLIPLTLADIEADIVRLSIALLRALDGDDQFLPIVQLNPPTPLVSEAEQIKKETPTLKEMEEWARSSQAVSDIS